MNERQVRVGVCEKRPPGARRLASILSSIDAVQIVGQAADGAQALTMIETMRPDLVLLDVGTPGMDALRIVERVTGSRAALKAPLFALLADSRRLAARAFDSGAMDFIQKPVRLSRLEKTFDRARERLSWRESERSLRELLGRTPSVRAERLCEEHVWVARRGETLRVDLDQLDRISADGPHVRLHLGDDSFLHREGIGSVAARLDPRRFARVHRSHAIRLDQVIGIGRTASGGVELSLHGGGRVPLGRKYSILVRRRLAIQGLEMGSVADAPATATLYGHPAVEKNKRVANLTRHGEQP